MTVDMAMLKQKVEQLERETRYKYLQLLRKHEQLELATLGFRDFRHRFISVYKRDMLPHEMDDKPYIRSGNNVVHSGNCKQDAELYSGNRPRYDHSVFEKLYGVRPETASILMILQQSAYWTGMPPSLQIPNTETESADLPCLLSEFYNRAVSPRIS